MAEIKLTKSQQAVVDDRGGELLVSAAAGSGKTKVLVDRLLSRICDENEACNIDDFLVITYTNAAAAELRLKISQALSQRLSQEPQNRHLQQQMRRIYLAEISTVHAFCSNLLRNYAYKLDVPGDFRMVEETEASVLMQKVLDSLLEQGYREDNDDFRIMVETFGYGRDDRRLADAVIMANRAMRCRPDMQRWKDETLKILDMSQYQDVLDTPWGAYVIAEFRAFLQKQINALTDALTELQYYPNIEKAYAGILGENIEQMRNLLACKTWDEIFAGQIESFGRLKPVKEPEDAAVKERIAGLRKKCWSDLKRWQTLIYAPSDALLTDLAGVMPGAQALIRFAADFDKAYSEEKQRRKLLDFSDLEHLAIKLLTDRYTGQPTEVAREIAERYVEIMVDEYQDSNQVQEVIFEAISKAGRNRFMVGDVKQSIYRFRLADPTLFLRKYETYPDHVEANPGDPRRILLSENFRSRPEILAACNDVFRLIMRKQVGDLDYTQAEELRAGREFPPLPQNKVELHCLTNSDAETTADKRDLEADFVARRIRELIDSQTMVTSGNELRPVKLSDIVILMRSVSNNAPRYIQALESRGIPAVCSQGGSLLDTTEVQMLVAMLQVIDNPHQDIPLISVLAGPVFGYTPDQLAKARIADKNVDCYDAILKAGGVFTPFLQKLAELREAIHWISLHELVGKILRETKMLSVFSAMADGEQRERNLRSFQSFVVGFEANGTRALPQLLTYLADLQANGGQLPMQRTTAENAVTIMSIHKSKGLEFPVVFLCDLSRQFNMQDMREAVLVDDELAVGCNCVDGRRYVRYPTLAKMSIERKKRRESISEELRVLYVAMTRPKDMLIMTYYSKRLIKELDSLNSQLTMPLSDDLCASVSSPGKWLLIAALCRTEAGELLREVGGNEVSQVSEYPWLIKLHDLAAAEEEATAHQMTDEQRASVGYSDLLQYSYPFDAHCDFPAKLTATQLKGRVQDMEVVEGAVELKQEKMLRFRKASFMPKHFTAAEKGTATHLFMQFAAYENCADANSVMEELRRLCAGRYLTQEQADVVQTQKIVEFFRSDLGQWLLSSKEVRREFKFSLLVDAGVFSQQVQGEKIMLQGVVDCFVCEEDGITILDFKTDRINGDARVRAEYYRPQIEAYAAALSRIYEMPVKRKLLYFFDVGKAEEL